MGTVDMEAAAEADTAVAAMEEATEVTVAATEEARVGITENAELSSC